MRKEGKVKNAEVKSIYKLVLTLSILRGRYVFLEQKVSVFCIVVLLFLSSPSYGPEKMPSITHKSYDIIFSVTYDGEERHKRTKQNKHILSLGGQSCTPYYKSPSCALYK